MGWLDKSLSNELGNKVFGKDSKIQGIHGDVSKVANPGGSLMSSLFGGDKGKDDYEASNRMAGILRRDWDSYLENYAPYDQKLRDMVMGDEDNKAAIERARDTTKSAFGASREAAERDRSRAGLALAQDEADTIGRRSQRNETLAELGAANKTRLHMQDRDMQMMAGNMAGGLREAATNPMGGFQ